MGWIGIMVMLAVAACARPDDDPVETRHGTSLQTVAAPQLQAIDSLMWQQPDSALAVLMNYLNDDGRDAARHVSTDETFNNHYANLLLAELLYKNYCEQTNRSELSQAVSYFDSLTSTLNDHPHASWRHGGLEPPSPERNDNLIFLDARAHYINGVGYYENDSMVEACKEYLKALEVMEEQFEEKELVGKKAKLVALTCTHLSALFSDFYLHEQVIYFAQYSLTYYKKLELPSWNMAWVLNKIGNSFDMMEELDSAESYYNKAATALHDTNSLMYRDIATHQAYLEYKKDSLQADVIIQQLENLLSKSENNIEYLARCAIIGELYYHERQFDSAWHCLNLVYCETSNIVAKKQAAERLAEICKAQGRVSEMHEYADFLVPFANQEENKSVIRTQLTQLFNTYRQTKTNRQHQIETNIHLKQAITVIGSLIIVILAVIVLYVRNKQHKRKLETQIETERHAHKMQQAALAGRLKRSNATLKGQDKTASSVTPFSFAQQPNGAESYVEEPICQEIIAVCNDKSNPIKSTVPVYAYASIALTDAQKVRLKEAVMRHYGPLFEKLKMQHPELKEKDLLYCHLCLLGLDNMQIAVLTQLSYRTIWEREKRLQALFHADDRIAIVLNEIIMH